MAARTHALAGRPAGRLVPLARRQLLHEPLKLGLALVGVTLEVYVAPRDSRSFVTGGPPARELERQPGVEQTGPIVSSEAILHLHDQRVATQLVGLTDKTASWMTPLMFVTQRDAAAMQGAPDSAGFVLVRGDGLPADRLAARLQQQFPRLNVMTRAELAANDQALAIAALALAAGVAAEPRSEPDDPPAERPVRRRGRSDAW